MIKTFFLNIWKWLSHNFGLKLLALISAFLIWISVVNSQDPIDTVTFHDIPVTVLNEDALIRKDKIPEIVYGSTVTITIQARKSICDVLTSDMIKATADFEKIYVTDTVPIEIEIMGYDDSEVEIIRGQNNYMKLSLEDYATKEFKIRVNTVGEPANGFVVGTSSSSPNVITIRGSKLQISRIQGVVAHVNVNGLSSDSEVIVNPVIYDMNDEAISTENLELSANSVSVSTCLYKTRVVRLEAVPIGNVADGYEIKSVSFQPSTITVAGTADDLMKLGDRLRAYIDVSNCSSNEESNIDIHSLFDSKLSSIRIIEEDTTLAVTAYIEEQEKKEFVIRPEDVTAINVSDGMQANVRSLSERILTVRAPGDIIKNLDLSSLKPYVDLRFTETPGGHEIILKFVPPAGVEVLTKEVVAEVELANVDAQEVEGTEGQ